MPTRRKRPLANMLLSALSERERRRVQPRMEPTRFEMKQVLYDVDEPISHVYFPVSGVCSLVLLMNDHHIAEVSTVGNEGMVGTPVFLGAVKSPTRAIAQVPGEAWRMSVRDFKREVNNGRPLQELIRRYTQAMINQISQSVACNNLHSVEQRLCRWLLLTHDRVGTDEFPITQEFLAQMLGVRRPSVTVVAGLLQRAGIIQYRRGRVLIVDRKRLEQSSCECYEVVRKEFERLLGTSVG